jgi:hypothetical protein
MNMTAETPGHGLRSLFNFGHASCKNIHSKSNLISPLYLLDIGTTMIFCEDYSREKSITQQWSQKKWQATDHSVGTQNCRATPG